ncbi:hypothetical protein SAMN05444166_4299 [Singulisphaera sp. GP187]|nr:hypothetical protein SAMN05444166_4299 [Singulisphaera sp. GP187]
MVAIPEGPWSPDSSSRTPRLLRTFQNDTTFESPTKLVWFHKEVAIPHFDSHTLLKNSQESANEIALSPQYEGQTT